MLRYIRAFRLALQMTLRGEKPPASRYPEWIAWTREYTALVDAVYAAAAGQGLGRAERQKLMLRLDGRSLSLETALATLKHHAALEYPSLLRERGAHNLSAIQAANLNDRYFVARLAQTDALQTPALQATLTRLDDHLAQPPPVAPDKS